MKVLTLIGASVLLLLSCGETHVIQSTPTNKSTKTSTPAIQQEEPGPVNMAQSNFYYSGQLSMVQFNPYFYICATSTTLPIVREDAFQDLINRYAKLDPTESKPAYAVIRGYTKTGKTGKELVVTYINSLQLGISCAPMSNLTGTYVGYIPTATNPEYRIAVTLQQGNTFIVNVFKGNSDEVDITTSGSWNLISANTIALGYTSENSFISHMITVGMEPNIMVFTNQQGTNVTLERKIEPIML